jgi:hypothetical protein
MHRFKCVYGKTFLTKTILISFLVCCIVVNLCIGQSIDYGLTVIYNSSTQTNSDPTLPEDGTSQWNYLGPGVPGFMR